MNFHCKILLSRLSALLNSRDVVGIRRLIAENEDLKFISSEDSSVLHLCRDDREMLCSVLDCGVSPDIRDSIGNTLLMDYAGLGDLDKMRVLIAYSANVNATNLSGESSLSIAVSKGRVDAAKLLVEAGADTKIIVGGAPLSIWAEKSGSAAMQRWMDERE